MRGRRMVVRAAVVLVAGAAMLAGPAAVTPAKASCVYLTFYVTWQGASPTYVNNGCVVNTPWNYRVTANPRYTGTGHPNGTPNGFFLDARVPAP